MKAVRYDLRITKGRRVGNGSPLALMELWLFVRGDDECAYSVITSSFF